MALQPGATLGPYEILSLIGAGGMGEVYLAREQGLGRRVALKVLPPEFTHDAHRIARFEQEARSASALSHPNICTIFALGELPDGRHFIAMEYIDGHTLRHRLSADRVSLRDALDIGSQIAAGVSAAHAVGIIHRDLKPDNVVIRRDGLVKVVDFGLAKLALSRDAHGGGTTHLAAKTDPGSAVGTIAYMSPEQARALEVDARTDIWSLGVVLYEMIAGRTPFAGTSTSDVLAAILDRDPPPLARFDPEAPPELQRMVGKALRKDRSQRYQTVQDLLLDLQALREDLQSPTRPGSTPATPIPSEPGAGGTSQTVPPVRQRRSRAGPAVAAAVLVLGAVLGVWAWRTARPAQTPGAEMAPQVQRNLTRLTFGSGLQTDVTWSPDGTRIAYAADRSGNFDIWSQPIAGGDPVQVTTSPAPDTQPAWSPDGLTIAFRREGRGVFVVPALGGPERQLSSFGEHPRWSPDGAAIMFTASPFLQNLFRVSPGGGEPPREILKEFVREGLWDWIAFHPDGRVSLSGQHLQSGSGFFTVSPEGGQVTTSSIPSGLPVRVAAGEGTRLRRFHWNPTGDALFVEAIVNEVRNVWKVKVEPHTLAWLSAERLTTGMGADVAAALSSDGAQLLFTTQRQSMRLWVFPFDAVAGRLMGEGRPVSPEDAEVSNSADLSPDGRAVVYQMRRAGSDRSDLWLTQIDSASSELFAQNAFGPCWSPDGKMLAYTSFRRRPPQHELALAVRVLGGAEDIRGRWSSKEWLFPQDWTWDGRAILLVYQNPYPTAKTHLELRPADNAGATASGRVLVKDPHLEIWNGRYSPDGRWLSFTAASRDESARFQQLSVVSADGGNRAEWTYIARQHEYPDKPRWAPDGRTIYFLSRHNSSYLNLWGSRFDAARGKPVGEPFMITHFDAPSQMISPDLQNNAIGISARRVALTMTTVTGNIWMLDNVDR